LPAIARTPGAVHGMRTDGSARAALHAVLIDSRHAQARSVAAELTARGVPVHSLKDGDITPLWARDIDPAWRVKPVTVAGLTERPALFCLEQLGFTYGLRVVYHGEHIVEAGGRTRHALLRGASAVGLSVRQLERAGSLWPALIAEVFTKDRPETRRARVGRSEAALAPCLPAGSHLLSSWIIARV